jgi:hypothetical protein
MTRPHVVLIGMLDFDRGGRHPPTAIVLAGGAINPACQTTSAGDPHKEN